MTDEDDEPGKILCECDDSQLTLDDADLLIQRESELLCMGLGVIVDIRRVDRELGPDLRDEPVMESLNEAIETSRQERFPQQDDPHDSRGQVDEEVGRNKIIFEHVK